MPRVVTESGQRWTQQGPHRWTTDEGWSLFYTDGPSWWLTSPDYTETDMCTRGFRIAMRAAANHINSEE